MKAKYKTITSNNMYTHTHTHTHTHGHTSHAHVHVTSSLPYSHCFWIRILAWHLQGRGGGATPCGCLHVQLQLHVGLYGDGWRRGSRPHYPSLRTCHALLYVEVSRHLQLPWKQCNITPEGICSCDAVLNIRNCMLWGLQGVNGSV